MKPLSDLTRSHFVISFWEVNKGQSESSVCTHQTPIAMESKDSSFGTVSLHNVRFWSHGRKHLRTLLVSGQAFPLSQPDLWLIVVVCFRELLAFE